MAKFTVFNIFDHIQLLRLYSLDAILAIHVHSEISNMDRDMKVEDALQKALDTLKERVQALTIDDLDKTIQSLKKS